MVNPGHIFKNIKKKNINMENEKENPNKFQYK